MKPQQRLFLPVYVAGPGREIIVNGMSALLQNRPDMNTLVGLGATASFGVSCVAAALPHLGWKTFFEEPAMLLGERLPDCYHGSIWPQVNLVAS